jgi:glycogen(starch) synthase
VLPFRAPKVVVGHSCCLSWWRAVHGTQPPASWREYRRRVAAGIRAADVFIAPTRAILAEFRREYLIVPEARVIPNGIDPGPEPRCGRDPVVFAAGRLWDEAKNTSILAEVAPRLPWPVLVAGACEGPVGSRPRHTGLTCLGRLSRAAVREHLDRASICIHPALYEPFGLVPLEAAAAGCALVLADIPTLRELWDGAAVFAPPRSAADIEQVTLDLTRNPSHLREVSAACRVRAREYSLERCAAGYARAYADLTTLASASRTRRTAGALA